MDSERPTRRRTVCRRLSAESGFWKTICTACTCSRLRLRGRGRPPAGPRARGWSPHRDGTMPRSTRASVVLPLPDSPTRPSVSPAADLQVDAGQRMDIDPRDGEGLGHVAGPTAAARACARRLRRRLRPRRAAASPPSARNGSASLGRRSPSYIGGDSVRQRSSTSPQRSAKMQPCRSAPGAGRNPGIVSSQPASFSWPRSRDAAQKPHRVGMPGLLEHLQRRPLLDHLAGVEHAHPVAHLGDHAQVVADEDAATSRSPRAAPRPVRAPRIRPWHPDRWSARPGSAGRDRLRAPWRSPRAAACRPRADAG